MTAFFNISLSALVLIILLSFYRVARGPTVYDRVLSIGAMGGKIIAVVCFFGLLYRRLDMFVDIALAYASLNFITGIAIAKYMSTRAAREGAGGK